MLFYRQFSLENVLFYVKCREKGVNGSRTLAIQFKTGRNKTFSELYHYLFVSFGFIESWVVPIRSRKERRLELLWIFNWAAITIPAYLRFSSLRLRVNLYIYLLSIARWVKVGTESRLIKGCLRQLYLSMRGRIGLPHYVHNLFFSLPLRCGLSLILRDRKARGNGIDEVMYRSWKLLWYWNLILKYFHGIFFWAESLLDVGQT